MKRLIAAFAFVCSLSWAQSCPSGYTQITTPFPTSEGIGWTGRIVVSRGYSSAGAVQGSTTFTVTLGSISAVNNSGTPCLYPGSYTATYYPTGSTTLNFPRTWTVTSSSPASVASIEGSGTITPVTTIALSQITAGTQGQFVVTDSTASVWKTIIATAPLSFNTSTFTFSMPAATGSQNGYLSSADWATFNSKEPAISAGTSGQYWRWDKTWATLNAAAVANAVDSTSSYSNPSWINTLAYSKITGVPSFAATTTAVSHQFFTAYNATTGTFTQAQPSCSDLSNAGLFCSGTTITSANVDSSIAKTGTDINTSNQVTVTHLAAGLPRAQGGLNSTSAGTGILRDGTTPTASELSGDATTSGSNAVTVVKVNGNTPGGTCTAQFVRVIDSSGRPTCQSIAAADLPANSKIRAFGWSFDGGGSALASGVTKYLTVPFACTISAWNIAVDTGTATVKTWKVATGTAIPTVSNSISTSGVAISSGTAVHSTTVSDFTSTTVSANDIFGFNLFAVSSATYVNFILECDQ